MRRVTYIRKVNVKSGSSNSEIQRCYRLTVVDETQKVTEETVDHFFVSFQNGFLDIAIKEFKAKFPKLKVQEKYEGTTAEVTVTKQTLWGK